VVAFAYGYYQWIISTIKLTGSAQAVAQPGTCCEPAGKTRHKTGGLVCWFPRFFLEEGVNRAGMTMDRALLLSGLGAWCLGPPVPLTEAFVDWTRAFSGRMPHHRCSFVYALVVTLQAERFIHWLLFSVFYDTHSL
jgi:hypothetical protein